MFWCLDGCLKLSQMQERHSPNLVVITNRVYYCRFGRSFKCWGTFPVAMPCIAVWMVTVVKCQLQYLWTLMSKKSLSLRELVSHRLPPAFKFQPKSLWTVLFWQLNVAKLLSSFLHLFPWGGRERKCRYFQVVWSIKRAINPFLYIYIKCNKEQKWEGRIG